MSILTSIRTITSCVEFWELFFSFVAHEEDEDLGKLSEGDSNSGGLLENKNDCVTKKYIVEQKTCTTSLACRRELILSLLNFILYFYLVQSSVRMVLIYIPCFIIFDSCHLLWLGKQWFRRRKRTSWSQWWCFSLRRGRISWRTFE